MLLQHGCKVTIFEARNRVGGRVAQSEHLGHLVDLWVDLSFASPRSRCCVDVVFQSGPNWIHGTKDNAIYEIAKGTGTLLHGWEEEQAVLDSQGCLVHLDEAAEYAELLWDDGIIAEAFRHSEESNDSIDPTRSLYDFFVEKSEQHFEEEPEHERRRKRETLLLFASMWGAYVGSSVAKQSLKFFWLEECIDGENPFVAETYHKILDHVAKPATRSADIKYGCKVTSIVSEENRAGRSKASIQTADGTSATFDEVVMTTLLGWLKHNKDAFKPPLPPRLSQAIDNIGYGTLDKGYITFPTAFWDVQLPGDTKLANGVDPEGKTPNVRAAAMPVHQPATLKTVRHDLSGSLFLSPAYAPNTNPEGWGQECLYLSALPSNCAHPTLLFYIYGDCSKQIAHLVYSAESAHKRDSKVLEFFEPYYSRLANYNSSDPACVPTAVLATAWARDEFAGYGSYSNFQVGLEHAVDDIEAMRYGMPERGVWLAGEHTAPFISLGTTTGAYVSGENVAKRILEAHSLEGVDVDNR